MTRNNYRQAKRSREDTRKKRQLEKLERKTGRKEDVARAAESPVDAVVSDLKSQS